MHSKDPLVSLLEQWRRDLADARTVVREKEIAVYTLEQTIAGKAARPETVPFRETQVGRVREYVKNLDGEFSISSVHDGLLESGMAFTSAKPKLMIMKVFDKMLKRGQIELTYKGSGSTPHRYKRTDVDINSDEVDQDA